MSPKIPTPSVAQATLGESLGASYGVLSHVRIRLGWNNVRALITPFRKTWPAISPGNKAYVKN